METCGGEAIYIPETHCDDCEQFLLELQRLREITDNLILLLREKQDKLTAGNNINIDINNVISAIDTLYSAGTGITITGANNAINAERNASNTYTKEEVNNLLLDLEHIRMTEVNVLPTTGETNVIYLVPSADGHDMYIWDVTNNRWVSIGRDTVDLSNYIKNTDLNTVSKDGIVLKGSGQAQKFWRTDASGNPSWRDVVIPVNPSAQPSENGAMWITT